MLNFIMMKGLPASGKSTWAKEFIKDKPDWVRVNNDDLNTMLFGVPFVKIKGFNSAKILDDVRELLITHFMRNPLNIIVDCTNLHPKHEANYRKKVQEHNQEVINSMEIGELYEFSVKDFTNVTVTECVRRNKMRSNSVPEYVIHNMYEQFLKPEVPVYTPNLELPGAVIIDIDGTVAKMNGRSPYDHTKYDTDLPVPEVIDVILTTVRGLGATPVFLTGRKEEGREVTTAWLKKHMGLEKVVLFMRPIDNNVPDYEFKEQVFNDHIRHCYSVVAWFEDRLRNVNMARNKIGLVPVFQVGDGDF